MVRVNQHPPTHLLGFGSIKKKRDGKNNGIQISKEIISGSLFFPSLYFPTY
jgi:hypothetical protein